MELGKQYNKDNDFKRLARKYQSLYRANILKVDYNQYGNRLTKSDACDRNLNYFQKLNVIKELRKRYPNYSQLRDADMLRSEHIPFNFFAPLKLELSTTLKYFNKILKRKFTEVNRIEFEYAPKPKQNYLNDSTSFDTYIEFKKGVDELVGVGIEMKYTEPPYQIGDTEQKQIKDIKSKYQSITNNCQRFTKPNFQKLSENDVRQIWRNHILGESIRLKNELSDFYSITIFPQANTHIEKALPKYKSMIKKNFRNRIIGIHFSDYISFLKSSDLNEEKKYKEWISYLDKRYLF